MQEEISLMDIFAIIKKHLLMIVGLTVVGLLAAFFVTSTLMTPKYASSTQLLVNHESRESTIQQSEINANIQLINTYEDIIRNPIILEEVRDDLTLNHTIEDLRNMITVQTDQNSQVFSIAVEDPNPYLASDIANTTANVFSENIDDIMSVDNVSIISEAIPSENPSSPNVILNTLVGAVLGLIIGLTIAFIKELLDTTVKDEEFLVEELGWPTLGRVSIIEKSDVERKEPSKTKKDDSVPSRRARK